MFSSLVHSKCSLRTNFSARQALILLPEALVFAPESQERASFGATKPAAKLSTSVSLLKLVLVDREHLEASSFNKQHGTFSATKP
jgi:hypothetical protein